MTNNLEATVIMTVFNDEKYFGNAIKCILEQSFNNFEFIIVNDYSTDGTVKILKSINDDRVRIINNEQNIGIAKSRNKGIKAAGGKYVFFTDSDCETEKDWLQNGVAVLKNPDALGVEGLTYYISKDYKPMCDDKLPGTLMTKGHYMGANIGFKMDILLKLNGFNENYVYHEDREFALRVLEHGKIEFCQEMIVKHLKKTWTPSLYFKSARRASDRIRLIKFMGERLFMGGFILYPKNLIIILIPPLVLMPILKGKCKSWNQFLIVLSTYPRAVYQRLIIWKTAMEYGIFIV